jgi:hypothetical protein
MANSPDHWPLGPAATEFRLITPWRLLCIREVLVKALTLLLRLVLAAIVVLLFCGALFAASQGTTKPLGVVFVLTGIASALDAGGAVRMFRRDSRTNTALAAVLCPIIGIYLILR